MKFLQEHPKFSIQPHPSHARLYSVTVSRAAAEEFLEKTTGVSTRSLNFVPFMRFIVAQELQETLGQQFTEAITGILRERATGGFTVQAVDLLEDMGGFLKWATAFGHLIGVPNFDAMSGQYYACFTVRDAGESDSLLRHPYQALTLHTDGTFVNDTTDWLIMMKTEQSHATGGRSRLLHLDDWESLKNFASHPLASAEVTYKGPPSKNVEESMVRRTFFERDGETCICFIDQFAYPRSLELARYLHDLSLSLEESPAVCHLSVPVGGIVVVNNEFWLHGREPFQKHPELCRGMMRQRGAFHIS